MVCKDAQCLILGASASFLDFELPPPMAKLRAICEGMEFAVSLGGVNLVVESIWSRRA